MANVKTLIVTLIVAAAGSAAAAQESKPTGVSALQDKHDRALLADLKTYIHEQPKAEDVEQAYMLLFNKAIEHDWFAEHETFAMRYLADQPDGPIQSLARIVSTMARAQAGKYAEALARYKELMRGLGKEDQEEFAANFADTLASSATSAGEYSIARQVYESLLERYSESPNLRQKVRSDLSRLDKVNKPAPDAQVNDVKGVPFRLADLKGKYVLVDFWATWCAPCIAELPTVQKAYTAYHDAGFEVVGISLDETKTALLDFVKTRNIPWRQVHNASSGGDLVEAFGVSSIPATFLIDPEGKIIRLDLRGPALDQALAKLIKGQAAAVTTQRPDAPPLR